MCKVVRRILSGRKLVGYLISYKNELKQVNLEVTKKLAYDGLIENMSYDLKADRFVGKGVDLRSLGAVQISLLNKNKLENNKVFYKIIKSGVYAGETVGLIRVKDIESIQIKNVQCNLLIIYSTENAVCCPHIDIDYRTVKVKNLILVNINESLLDMLYPSGVKQFIDMLDSINYIKSDGFLTIYPEEFPGRIDFRYRLTNTNWYLGITSETGFIYDYREFISENSLDLTVYMNKLYNDKVVRQIVTGDVQLILNDYDNSCLSFLKFVRQLKTYGNNNILLLAYRLDASTIRDTVNYPDALIDLDIGLVDKLIRDCTDIQMLRKMIFPNTLVFRIIGKENKVYDSIELYKHTIKYAENLANLHRKQYEDRRYSVVKNVNDIDGVYNKDIELKYSRVIDIPEISKLLCPLESKLKLLNLEDSSTNSSDRQLKELKSRVASGIMKYLLNLYKKNINLELYMSDMLSELICKYCDSREMWIDNKICVRYNKGTPVDPRENRSCYDVYVKDVGVLIDNPDLSVFVNDVKDMFTRGMYNFRSSDVDNFTILSNGRKVEYFNLSDYNFVNVRSFNAMFAGAKLKKVVLDGTYLGPIDGVLIMFNNAIIDEIIIKNLDFSKVRESFMMVYCLRGDIVVLNLIMSELMFKLNSFNEAMSARKYRLEKAKMAVRNNTYDVNIYTNDPMIKFYNLNETVISDGAGRVNVDVQWKNYRLNSLEYGDSTKKLKDDYIEIHKNSGVKLRKYLFFLSEDMEIICRAYDKRDRLREARNMYE